MLARTPWQQRAKPARGEIGLADEALAALLTTAEPNGIGVRIAEMVREPVTRLIVISPHWDMDLAELKLLAGRLNPTDQSVSGSLSGANSLTTSCACSLQFALTHLLPYVRSL